MDVVFAISMAPNHLLPSCGDHGCLSEFTVDDVLYYKETVSSSLPRRHGNALLWVRVISPAAAAPLLAATGWICTRAGRFAVIMEQLLLLFVLTGAVWIWEDVNVFAPLLAIQTSFVAPGLLAAAVLYMYECIPLGKRLGCMLTIPLFNALARLISVAVTALVTNPTRHEIIVDAKVTQLAHRVINAHLGVLVGFGVSTCLVGVLLVRRDTALGLVARGRSADAFSALTDSGDAPMHKDVYMARVEAEKNRERPSLRFGPVGLLTLLVAAQAVLCTSFLETFRPVADAAICPLDVVSPVVGKSVELCAVAVVSLLALVLWLRVGQVRYLPSAIMVAASIGAVVCASLPLAYPEAHRFASQTSPPSAVVGVVGVQLGLPLLEWTIWVLANDLFSSKARPGGVFGVVALIGAFKALVRYQAWANVFSGAACGDPRKQRAERSSSAGKSSRSH